MPSPAIPWQAVLPSLWLVHIYTRKKESGRWFRASFLVFWENADEKIAIKKWKAEGWDGL